MSRSVQAVHPAHKLLERAHSPDTAQTIFTEKVLRKPLILRPTSPDPTSKDARSARRLKRLRKREHLRRKGKPKALSAKERRALGVHDLKACGLGREPGAGRRNELLRWGNFVPLWRLWCGYVREILGIEVVDESVKTVEEGGEEGDQKDGRARGVQARGTQYVTGQSVGPKLASADYHGAHLEVVRSKCVSRVGVGGIVLKDTKFTFEIITRRNELKSEQWAGDLFVKCADGGH